MGLTFEDDLGAWQRWQSRRHPLRLARGAVATRVRQAPPVEIDVWRGGPDSDLLVAVEATHASVRAAVVEVLAHLDPARVTVVAPHGASLPPELGAPTTVPLEQLTRGAGGARVILAAGHYTAIGAAAHAFAQRQGAAFVVAQHGLLTPLAPPLPAEAHLLAWSAADAAFWTGRRGDVDARVVGSQLLWAAAQGAPQDPARRHEVQTPVYLGQLHGAELPRSRLARAAYAFCRAHDAAYRPHPSERDRVSRLLHASWRRRGIRFEPGTTPLADLAAPVVSVFSTGVLEAAARGLPAWVDFPDPPAWLREFWDRYAMREYAVGAAPTPAPALPVAEPARAAARILEDLS